MNFPSYLIALNAFLVTFVGMVYVAPRIRKPKRHSIGFALLFLLVLVLNFSPLRDQYGTVGAILRSLFIASTPFIYGYFMSFLLPGKRGPKVDDK